MRALVTVAGLSLLAVVSVVAWLWTRGPTEPEAEEIARVLAPSGAADAPSAYAHCASCHLHDGSGRPDGSIPRLNGQRRAVLVSKLHRLRAGSSWLPVMSPFARSLKPEEISEIASYLEALPETARGSSMPSREERVVGASLYAMHCASCHGDHGEGHDGLAASRLCGQYEDYLARRLREARVGARGEADAVMKGVLEGLPDVDLEPVIRWLAAGAGCVPP